MFQVTVKQYFQINRMVSQHAVLVGTGLMCAFLGRNWAKASVFSSIANPTSTSSNAAVENNVNGVAMGVFAGLLAAVLA